MARATGRELPLLLPKRGAWKLLNGSRLILFELPLCLLPVLFLVSIMEKRTKGVAGAGIEVAEGWFLKGGGAVCGGRPRDFLPMPLLLFFLSMPVAEDTALVGLPP